MSRLGKDELIANAQQESRISMEDYAIALGSPRSIYSLTSSQPKRGTLVVDALSMLSPDSRTHSTGLRLPDISLLSSHPAPARGLSVVCIQNRGDQPREALLNLRTATGVVHLHATPLTSHEPCFAKRLEML
jgi:hypothetical protein